MTAGVAMRLDHVLIANWTKNYVFSLLSQWAFRSRGQGAGLQNSSRDKDSSEFEANRETPDIFLSSP